MLLNNILHPTETSSYKNAVVRGMGKNRGLFFHNSFNKLPGVESLLKLDFVERSAKVLHHLIGSEIEYDELNELVSNAFNFDVVVKKIYNDTHCLELFHGHTLAFKDFGGRFMAQCLSRFNENNNVTVLTATSGDTGAAVAHAFYKIPGIQVKILYPKGKISNLQEKLFCTLGHNIETFAVDGDFDDCQRMVKASFDDDNLRNELNLTSANSINISRLYAQVCYYFEAVANLDKSKNTVISVPSGNFGNLSAGLIAKRIGAPIHRFVASTNSNDTVPRYLIDKIWSPNKTVETASNAMDVSDPSNWPRIMHLYSKDLELLKQDVSAALHNDEETFAAMRELYDYGYISEPHTAIAYRGLTQSLKDNEQGVFVGTAHPAKFIETVEKVLEIKIELPNALKKVQNLNNLSVDVTNNTDDFKKYLLK